MDTQNIPIPEYLQRALRTWFNHFEHSMEGEMLAELDSLLPATDAVVDGEVVELPTSFALQLLRIQRALTQSAVDVMDVKQ